MNQRALVMVDLENVEGSKSNATGQLRPYVSRLLVGVICFLEREGLTPAPDLPAEIVVRSKTSRAVGGPRPMRHVRVDRAVMAVGRDKCLGFSSGRLPDGVREVSYPTPPSGSQVADQIIFKVADLHAKRGPAEVIVIVSDDYGDRGEGGIYDALGLPYVLKVRFMRMRSARQARVKRLVKGPGVHRHDIWELDTIFAECDRGHRQHSHCDGVTSTYLDI